MFRAFSLKRFSWGSQNKGTPQKGNSHKGDNGGNNSKFELFRDTVLGNWPYGKLSFWETVILGNFLLEKILLEKYSGKLPLGNIDNKASAKLIISRLCSRRRQIGLAPINQCTILRHEGSLQVSR